jgi:hypothetical protein
VAIRTPVFILKIFIIESPILHPPYRPPTHCHPERSEGSPGNNTKIVVKIIPEHRRCPINKSKKDSNGSPTPEGLHQFTLYPMNDPVPE